VFLMANNLEQELNIDGCNLKFAVHAFVVQDKFF
jgi:hypothetical protein